MTEAASTRMQQLREECVSNDRRSRWGSERSGFSITRRRRGSDFRMSWNQVEPSDDTTIDEWLRFVEQAERNKAATAGRALVWLPESRAEVVGGSLGGFGAGGTVTGLATAIVNGLGLALRRLGAWELRVERWGLPLGPYLESLRFATRLSRRLGPEILVGRRWGDPSGREPSGQPALWLED